MKLESFIQKIANLSNKCLELYQNVTTTIKDMYKSYFPTKSTFQEIKSHSESLAESITPKMDFVKNDEILQGKLVRIEEHMLQKTTYIASEDGIITPVCGYDSYKTAYYQVEALGKEIPVTEL
ncbi:MAG: hypothetical protein RCG16_07525 [Rickettsia hoogstraalii]|uniref:hypothetical protein n=1 Tax=Rickettsia hoogstraalii TaxID=467174 RepID=UPI000590CAAD|nr:hypothetical protein [Rickettsia hoogstraalii]KJV81401.1 hypothetical protein RHORCCE3_0588 [Rickettsia hoogstraalii str. RCCE3]